MILDVPLIWHGGMGDFHLKFSTYGSGLHPLIDMVTKLPEIMQKGWKFLKNSVIQMGPFVKVQIHVESTQRFEILVNTHPIYLLTKTCIGLKVLQENFLRNFLRMKVI